MNATRHWTPPTTFFLIAFVTQLVGIFFPNAGLGQPLAKVGSEKQLEQVFDQVSSAMVRITSGPGQPFVAIHGVVVSKEGHILTGNPPDAMLRAGLVFDIQFPDGKNVQARTLGWSNEFHISLLQITTPKSKPWPAVKLAAAKQHVTGAPCIALGYARDAFHSQAAPPTMQSGHINRSGGSTWGTTSYETWNFGDAVFDLNGQLLGITTHYAAHFFRELNPKRPGDRDPVHTQSTIVRKYWDDLVAGRNVDDLRVRSKKLRGPSVASADPKTPPEQSMDAAIERARRASIRLRRTGSKPNGGSSGVVVSPDGHIVTCAHHFLLPGDDIVVAFEDGSEVAGKILGTNWVTDICVAKITDEGNWPHVPLGNSLVAKRGDKCFTIGYPARRQRSGALEKREIAIHQSQIIEMSVTGNISKSQPLSSRIVSAGLRASGESGGGLFNAKGEVIGVAEGLGRENTNHIRIEIIRGQWELLTQQRQIVVAGD